ncbi:MAG: response regulator [Kofleriaceae bacterium]|nr:response regulator [Kofleriaceae bacterium]
MLRQRLAATALERLRIACLGGIGFSVLAAGYFALAHPDVAWILNAGVIIGCLYSLVVYAAVQRGRVPERWASGLATVAWSLGTGLTALGFGLTGRIEFTVLAAIQILLASLHLFRSWLLGSAVLFLALWMPIGFATYGGDFGLPAVAFGALWLITIMTYEASTRYFAHLEALRERDRQHQHERELLQEQLLHAQKLEAVGTLAGGVAHDMNNVLAAIIGVAELLRDDLTSAARDDVDQILESARRGAELTRNLLGFSRRGTYSCATFAVAEMLDGVVKLLRRTLPKGVTIDVEALGDDHVAGDAAQLSHAVMNVCLNAVDAMEGAGLLRLDLATVEVEGERARALAVAPGRYVQISIRDTGCGMSREVQTRAFDPFFTTKPQGRGTGLGLAMVYGTTRRHGGAVTIDSEVGRGTTVAMLLPPAAAAPAAVTLAPARSAPGTGHVLVVDDEPSVRAVTCRTLERSGYRVTGASNGQEALELFRQHAGGFDAVVLDLAMPVMDGAECFTRLKEVDPRVRVALASGYARSGAAERCLAGGAAVLLTKPFTPLELTEAVARMLRAPDPDRSG